MVVLILDAEALINLYMHVFEYTGLFLNQVSFLHSGTSEFHLSISVSMATFMDQTQVIKDIKLITWVNYELNYDNDTHIYFITIKAYLLRISIPPSRQSYQAKMFYYY